jgi:hypothetical protein
MVRHAGEHRRTRRYLSSDVSIEAFDHLNAAIHGLLLSRRFVIIVVPDPGRVRACNTLSRSIAL